MNKPGSVAVLVPAAGYGSRLGGLRKQFRTLGGAALLVQTLRVFERHSEVDDLCVALPPTMEGVGSIGRLTKLRAVVEGGETRSASVAEALRATDADIVLVHDAVRPFVDASMVSRVIEATREHGAAALAMPVMDTVRYGVAGRFVRSISRSDLFRMQTPQGFIRTVLEDALAAGAESTDEVEPVMRLGHPVHIVEGSAWNFKITTPMDWELARLLWPRWQEEYLCA